MARTKEEKENKFKQLPAHHLDSSVIIEILRKQPRHNECYSYIYNSGKSYRLAVSLSVLGEIFKFLLELAEADQRTILFEAFDRLISKFKIEITLPSFETYKIISKLLDIDNRLESVDCLNYASAVDAKAETFVTLDRDFTKNLEKGFEVRIKLI